MLNKRYYALLIFVLSELCITEAGKLCAQPHKILKGRVTCENKGLKDVVVSNGIFCVQTDEDGKYQLESSGDSQLVYLSTPAGYITERKDKTIPLFYKQIAEGVDEYNFELYKNPKNDLKHLFAAQADVQIIDTECLKSYQMVIEDCKTEISKYAEYDVFGVDCGDIVGDNQSLFPLYINAVSILDIPIYRAMGNHDMDYHGRTHETSEKTFEKYFGPTHYSFNKGKAHYIVLNNNFFIGRDYFYMGYIDEKTFSWLEQDLKFVDKDSPIFLIIHIPSRLQKEMTAFSYNFKDMAGQTVNAGALYKLLAPYNSHIISGHTHYNVNIVFSANLMEHITGAVCATWWRGDICLDGTPRGYGVYKVNGRDIKWYYKSTGFSNDYQFRIYDEGVYKAYPQDIVANVWNWDERWKVEWLEDGKLMGEMTRFSGVDAQAEAMCADKQKIKYNWISAVATEHLFRATPFNSKAKIEIKVTDRFGSVFLKKYNRKSL